MEFPKRLAPLSQALPTSQISAGSEMNLPFTQEQFFEIFPAYNVAVWPAQFVLNVLAIAMVVLVLRAPERAERLVSYGLALLWCWLALAYHLAFFWSINPAAPFFAGVSLAAAGAFAWFGGVRGALQFQQGMSARSAVGLSMVMFALAVYPAIGEYIGHRYPALPTFGLPCPTAIFTLGVLLMAVPSLQGGSRGSLGLGHHRLSRSICVRRHPRFRVGRCRGVRGVYASSQSIAR